MESLGEEQISLNRILAHLKAVVNRNANKTKKSRLTCVLRDFFKYSYKISFRTALFAKFVKKVSRNHRLKIAVFALRFSLFCSSYLRFARLCGVYSFLVTIIASYRRNIYRHRLVNYTINDNLILPFNPQRKELFGQHSL